MVFYQACTLWLVTSYTVIVACSTVFSLHFRLYLAGKIRVKHHVKAFIVALRDRQHRINIDLDRHNCQELKTLVLALGAFTSLCIILIKSVF